MSQKTTLKPLAIALGTAFVTTLAATPVANAADNPFAMTNLSGGYMVAGSHEGKCGEGKCGASKAAEAKCGGNMAKEAKCGMNMMDTDGDGLVSEDEFMKGHKAMFSRKDANSDGVIDAGEMKMMEGKCGEGKCGASNAAGKVMEAKCGEGKCGGNK